MDALTKLEFPNVVEAELMMRVEYEKAFNIYDHSGPDNPNVPWPLLAISPKESLNVVDPLKFRTDQFAENRVAEIFGMSFDQLIQYPRRDYLIMIESAKKHSNKLDGLTDSKLRSLERAAVQIAQSQKKQT